ncbi:MAG: FAD-binding oxidoreductase [Thermoanaerobaculia bacterium]
MKLAESGIHVGRSVKSYESWGRYPRVEPARVVPLFWGNQPLPARSAGESLLAFGQGRSYGDSCLNAGGTLLDTAALSRFIAFDEAAGLLRCESGTTFAEILDVIVPRGWFLPVSPGTRFVSVGGAIANDVHGKNHHVAGTFGAHVTRFELERSDGTRLVCSPDENAEMFRATIGGLGLTGLILWAEFRLTRMVSPLIAVEKIRFSTLDEFFEINAASDKEFAYTVAWIDSLARGESLARGIFIRGNHVTEPSTWSRKPLSVDVPIDLPSFLLNGGTMRLFNEAYYRLHRGKTSYAVSHYEPFFYPLDMVRHWNRIYGARGFLQYQCVVPFADGRGAIREILERIARSGLGSFLSVLKTFGDRPSPGLLSFPRPGVTLALDFAFQGTATLRLLDELDGVVRAAGGAVYPAKDARMSPESFDAFFPQWRALARAADPAFSSSFWRRVTGPLGAAA